MNAPVDVSRRADRTLEARGIIFDLDGTLIDSYDAIAESLNHALVAMSRPTIGPERVRTMVGRGLEVLVKRALVAGGLPDPESAMEEGIGHFRRHYEVICVDKTRLLPGVEETMTTLFRRGYRMAVATNKPSYFASRILDALGVGSVFDVVLGPDRVAHPKPHPEMVTRALELMGISADEAVYVGDMEIDVETARNAGMRAIVMPTGSSDLDHLERSGADIVVRTFPDLLDLLPDRSG